MRQAFQRPQFCQVSAQFWKMIGLPLVVFANSFDVLGHTSGRVINKSPSTDGECPTVSFSCRYVIIPNDHPLAFSSCKEWLLTGPDCLVSSRCWTSFSSLSDLTVHQNLIALGQKCDAREPPPQTSQLEDIENRVTPTISKRLIERKRHLKVCTWEDLWEALFPNDVEVPSSGAYMPRRMSPEFMGQPLTFLDEQCMNPTSPPRKPRSSRPQRRRGCTPVMFSWSR
jgi:hypothetical protein